MTHFSSEKGVQAVIHLAYDRGYPWFDRNILKQVNIGSSRGPTTPRWHPKILTWTTREFIRLEFSHNNLTFWSVIVIISHFGPFLVHFLSIFCPFPVQSGHFRSPKMLHNYYMACGSHTVEFSHNNLTFWSVIVIISHFGPFLVHFLSIFCPFPVQSGHFRSPKMLHNYYMACGSHTVHIHSKNRGEIGKMIFWKCPNFVGSFLLYIEHLHSGSDICKNSGHFQLKWVERLKIPWEPASNEPF